MPCLDETVLLEYLGGRLNDDAARHADQHLDQCEACRAVLATLATTSLCSQEGAETAGSEHAAARSSLPSIGSVLSGRFRLIRVLGSGGMGVVYEALDEVLGHGVAIKLLHSAASAEGSMAALKREVLMARRITHPAICRVFDVSIEAPPFISMELVRGENLAKLIEDGVLNTEQRLLVFRGVCEGLQAAHQGGIVHRDLKPANVMVELDPIRVKLMDFGLARDDELSVSVYGKRVGTPAYWSPEQARGEQATFSSDIYGLGAIGYHLFSGNRFLGRFDPMVDSPPGVEAVLRMCLATASSERPRSPQEVALLLDRQTTRQPVWDWHRWAGLSLVFISIGAIATWLGTGRTESSTAQQDASTTSSSAGEIPAGIGPTTPTTATTKHVTSAEPVKQGDVPHTASRLPHSRSQAKPEPSQPVPAATATATQAPQPTPQATTSSPTPTPEDILEQRR